MRLMLASASPRRADLLRAAGFSFETFAVEVDESPRAGERAPEYVERLAREKSARALARAVPELKLGPASRAGPTFRSGTDIIVIGADTAVVVDDEILGKPAGEEDARRMLRRLSGRTHEVLTGVCVRTPAAALSAVEVTVVCFSPLSAADVDWYVASGEGTDKAGGYAIQGLASRFIPRIEGSYANVVGLPVARVAELLTRIRQLA